MEYTSLITIVQLIVSILLMVSILLQQRGSGLSGVLGGDDSVYRSKRGAEKTLFYASIVFAIIFIGLSSLTLFI